MKIFLTGSTGMVGKNLLKVLNKNYEVICTTSKSLNLLDFKKTKKFITKTNPDIVIHCAGLVGGIEFNRLNNFNSLNQNLEIGKNLINACYEAEIKKLINFSSSCIYPKNIFKPLKEKDVLSNYLEDTNEGYALAKIFAMKLCQYINKEKKGYSYKTIIPCNLYGFYDTFHYQKSHMLPSAMKKIHEAKVGRKKFVEIWGTGKHKREFMFATDLANFTKFALKNYKKIPAVINIGTGKDYTINYYYKLISKVIGYNGMFKHNYNKPDGTKRKLVDISLQNKIGWSPATSLEEGINKTYKYYLKIL